MHWRLGNNKFVLKMKILKFIYSEKATKFFPLLFTVCTIVKSKGKILQNCVAFSEYMNFTYLYWISQVLLNIWDIWLITKNSPLFCNRLNHFSGTWKKQTTLRHFWKSLRASFVLLKWFNIKPSQPCRCYVMCTFETFLRNKVDSIFWCTIVAKDF